ncbi:thymidylate kinase [Drepanopeziza brunnea f. sp. 'multigermtubi' MB_m1]|uniref:Thymidylate kinase n=1 Tax=Marssonina brunnea f. sp. multigermtubi (strain MB_m1) TaxID=1072389 RepID=K1X2L8_MARBU|nr:thymidylate kinase [Drepanopeziza brunnea f. sp. 'multigermtubi' MB_m1]EKD19471.1 thymidylate kinase [Drepanopeziza brunnea f. sp. 'multigermtubi' MB_m1]
MSASPNDPYPWQEPADPITRGAFIVIEGLDRAGKTTQVKRICDRLYASGHNVKTIRFPDRTSPIGSMIDRYLQSALEMDDHAIHLLFSANRWEKAKWIRNTLASGSTIVCDRYYYSGMVYSAAKQNPSLSLSWAQSPDAGLPKPDVVVFLDLEAEEAEKRGGYGEEKYEKRDMQMRVRELFLALLEGEGDEKGMRVVNAGAGVDVVGERIWKEVEGVVRAVSEGSHGKELDCVRAWKS